MICLSSPDGEDNFFSKWAAQKDDDGTPLMKTIRTSMICKKCMKLPYDEAVNCKHVKQHAHWINSRRADRIKKLYIDDPALAMQEFGGAIVSRTIKAFMKEDVVRFFTRDCHRSEERPNMIITAADSCGAGSSHLALTSLFFTGDSLCVVSFSNIQIGPDNGIVKTVDKCDNVLNSKRLSKCGFKPLWKFFTNPVKVVHSPEGFLGVFLVHTCNYTLPFSINSKQHA